jgi:Molybdopterin guanine dinucleotide synthesis protein B
MNPSCNSSKAHYRSGNERNPLQRRNDIDLPGKDNHRLTAAGADTMMITSASMLAMVKRHAASPPIEELLNAFRFVRDELLLRLKVLFGHGEII